MNVLAHTIGIMARHYSVERILGIVSQSEPSAVAIPCHIVTAGFIGLPDFHSRIRQNVPTRVHDATSYPERKATVSRLPERVRMWSALSEEWSQHIWRGWLELW